MSYLDVVGTPGRLVDPAAADPLLEHRVGHLQRADICHALSGDSEDIIHGLGLGECSREAVEDEAGLAVGFHDAIFDDPNNNVIADELARLHQTGGLLPPGITPQSAQK